MAIKRTMAARDRQRHADDDKTRQSQLRITRISHG
jgi:hypothetical protein